MNIQSLPQLSNAGLYNACEGSLYYIVPSASENMCINPSFEFDTTSWASTGTISRVVSGYSGYYALQAVLTANQTVTHTLARNPTAVQHAASLYIFHNGSTAVTINVQVADTSTIANRSYTIPANQWTRVQVSFIGRNAATVFRIVASSSCTLRLDACQIEISSNGATTYFDGDTLGTQQSTQIAYPQYGWYGTEHKSYSFRNRQATNGGIIVDLQSYGFQLISITGTGNPTFDNQIATFASTDGGILQDTVVPTREIAFLGRISGSTKTELHQRLQTFMALFQRDQVSYYQPRSWKFQHKSGREDIGQEMSFSAVLVSAVAADITDQLSVDITIQLNMTDPYFYGHDIAQQIPSAYLNPVDISATRSFDMLSTYQNNNQTDTAASIPYRYILGSTTCVYAAPDGFIYVGYTASTIVDRQTGVTYNFANLARFSPNTQTWSAVTSVDIFSYATGVEIYDLQMTPDKKYLFIGSNCNSTVGAQPLRQLVVVTIATGAWSSLGVITQGSGTTRVWTICIDPRPNTSATYGYRFFIGGTFTSIDGNTRSRLAEYITSFNDVGGFPYTINNTVRHIAIDIAPTTSSSSPQTTWLIISGEFTQIINYPGPSTLNVQRIVVKNLDLGGNTWYALSYDGTTFLGLNYYPEKVIVYGYRDWIIGGYFTYLVNNATGANVSAVSGLIRVTDFDYTLTPTSYIEDIGYSRVAGSFVMGTAGTFVIKNNYLYFQFYEYDGTVLLKLNMDNLDQMAVQLLLPENIYKFDVDELGNVYFGMQPTAVGSVAFYPKPINFVNNGTVSAALTCRVQLISGAVTTRYMIGFGNFTNQRVVQFVRPLTGVGYELQTDAPQLIVGKIVSIDCRVGIAIDSISGSLISRMSPNSDLYTLVALPGTNVVYIHLFDKDNTPTVGTWEAVVKITQTYQSLFDGVNGI